MAKRNKAVIAVVGLIFLLLGAFWTIAFALKDQFLLGILGAGGAVVIGVLLIAWAFGGVDETH